MKFFTNKSIWTKIIIVLIFVILFEFVVTKPSLGATSDILEWGGKLLSPVLSLVVTVGDGLMAVMHEAIMGTGDPLIHADLGATIWQIIGNIFVTIIAAAVAVGAFVLTGGLVVSLLAGIAVGFYASTQVVNDLAADKVIGAVTSYSEKAIPENLYLPAYTLSPQEIFEGKILLFNVDFFSEPVKIQVEKGPVLDKDGNPQKDASGNDIQEIKKYYYIDENGEEVATSPQNMGEQLSGTISSWYVSIRNIALVAMMIVLLYIGIRMLLSTLASDKAKYKQMLQDWLVGVMLLFLMHYIMAFSVMLVGKLTDIVSSSIDEQAYYAVIPMSEDGSKANKFKDFVDKAGLQDYYIDENKNPTDRDNAKAILYPTNLLGYLRLDIQLTQYGSEYVGKAICFVVLVFMTVFFVFTYLRRVLYMAFLTMIAPVVAVTYPIDKINDGKAQGFTRWFREYIFNLLIQPMHLLLYYVLITSAFELAGQNVVYSLVAIGFMIPAEKLLRSFFGFEKASTPGLLAGPAGAALAMTAINKITSLAQGKDKGKSSSSGGGKNGSGSGDGEDKIREAKNPLDGDVSETNTVISPSQNEANRINDERDSINADQNALDEMKGEATSDEDRAYIEEEQEKINRARDLNLAEEARNKKLAQEEKEKDRQETAKYGMPIKLNTRQKIRRLKNNPAYRNATVRYYGGKVARVGLDAAANGIKTVSNVATKVIPNALVGAGVGSLGLAAGIAGGDPSKSLSYFAAGAAGGYMAGNRVTSKINSAINGKIDNGFAKSNIGRGSKEEYYDNLLKTSKDEETRKVAEEQIMRIKSKDYRDTLKKNGYDKNTINEMQENGTINRYIKNDIDANDMVAAERMREDTGMTQEQAIAYAKYTNRVGDAYKGADATKWKKQFSEEFKDKAGMKQEQADKAAKDTWKGIGDFRKYQKKVIK